MNVLTLIQRNSTEQVNPKSKLEIENYILKSNHIQTKRRLDTKGNLVQLKYYANLINYSFVLNIRYSR